MTRQSLRITYVEDEPDIRAIAQIVLEDVAGHTLSVCTCGSEAVSSAPSFRPDLILLDVMMPDMDGIETFHALMQFTELSATPVVFMTAKVQTVEVERYRSIGAAGVIAKPFDPMTLAGEILAIWQASDASVK
jgi:CheY-like chemotaxis protein